MRLHLFTAVLVAAPHVQAATAAAQSQLPLAFNLDTDHSSITFRIPFMGLSQVKGEFAEFSGALLLADDPTRSSATVVIQTASIDTHGRARDKHLRSPDFFDAEKYPVILFRSTRIQRRGKDFVMHGTLSMHGVTRNVVIPFTQLHPRTTDAWRNTRVTYRGTTKVSRRDYDIRGTAFWNSEFDPGRFAVGDTATIELEVSATIPNTAQWTIPKTDSLVAVAEARGVDTLIREYNAVSDTTARPDAGALAVAAYKLLQRKRMAEGIQLLEWAAERALGAPGPIRSMAFALAGEANLQLGSREKAVKNFERALSVNPYDPRALEWLRYLGFPTVGLGE